MTQPPTDTGVRVLLVEDEPKLAAFIHKGLTEDAYSVETAPDGETALQLARSAPFDIVILDIELPGMDGFAVCRAMRALHSDVPILMLSARGMIEDRVRGLDTGADDYLTKPFAFSELSARLRALLRRQPTAAFMVLTVADLTLDPVRRLVTRNGRRLDLTPKELALLEYLMRNAGQVLTRAMIAEQVWDVTWDRLTNVIDVFINHLRKKLEEGGGPRLIHAVRGVGYVMRSDDESSCA
ncbi:MAG TPA: response regulator transcription factor [Vicinamibacterales bacterium]|nr:response regulator transcription factor [Vicinamibacterales bacterium]